MARGGTDYVPPLANVYGALVWPHVRLNQVCFVLVAHVRTVNLILVQLTYIHAIKLVLRDR
jgi:hypothetical protein